MSTPPNWLGGPYPPSAADDHIAKKLVDLRVLENETDEQTSRVSRLGSRTPQTLQVITAGASQLSKWWIGLVGTGFGLSALIQGVVGLGWDAFGATAELSEVQQAVLTASAAVVASALVIAIAVMVRGDVASRALASAAQYNARAAITQALIGGFQYPGPIPQPHARYLATTRNGTSVVRSFGHNARGLFAVTEDGMTIVHGDITSLVPIPSA